MSAAMMQACVTSSPRAPCFVFESHWDGISIFRTKRRCCGSDAIDAAYVVWWVRPIVSLIFRSSQQAERRSWMCVEP